MKNKILKSMGACIAGFIVASLCMAAYSNFYNVPLLGSYQINNAKVVHLGASALDGNLFVGQGGANVTAGGTSNTAAGLSALLNNTTGAGNSALGRYGLAANLTGTENTAVGYAALYSDTGQSYNTAVGSRAGYSGGGGYNTYLGAYSGQNTGTTYYNNTNNVAVGYHAGYYELGSNSFYLDNQDRTNTAGDKAKALMYGTFASTAAAQYAKINATLDVDSPAYAAPTLHVDAATHCVGIGTAAPDTLLELNKADANAVLFKINNTGGTYLQLGAGGATGYGIASWINAGFMESVGGPLSIGAYGNQPIQFYTGNDRTTAVTISGTGKVGIGTATPTARLTVQGVDTGTNYAFEIKDGNTGSLIGVRNDGNWYAPIVSVTPENALYQANAGWVGKSSSSQRYKKDIVKMDDDVLKLLTIETKRFTYKKWDTTDFGGIAEDFVAAGLTPLVNFNADGTVENIKDHKIVWYLIEIAKKQQSRIDALEKRLEKLEKVK